MEHFPRLLKSAYPAACNKYHYIFPLFSQSFREYCTFISTAPYLVFKLCGFIISSSHQIFYLLFSIMQRFELNSSCCCFVSFLWILFVWFPVFVLNSNFCSISSTLDLGFQFCFGSFFQWGFGWQLNGSECWSWNSPSIHISKP